jgi:hypothetical protein
MRLTSIRLLVLIAAACCSMIACDPGADEEPGGSPDDDPYCHWDCFSGSHSCEDGVVTSRGGGSIPCSEWEGDCPLVDRYMCEQGCRTDISWLDGNEPDPSILCEEHRPRVAGDRCEDDLDCRPFTVVTEPDGALSPIHLVCDVQQGTCVETAPPVIDGYMTSCEVTPSDIVSFPGHSPHVLDDTSCVTGLCLADNSDQRACVPQGCTVTCADDADCPARAVCKTILPDTDDEIERRVCVPAMAWAPFLNLSCPD